METSVLIKFRDESVISSVSTHRGKRLNGSIPVHWLYKLAYCEYQLYLEIVKGIKPRPTIEMVRGKEIHQALEEEHKRKAIYELSVSEAIARSVRERECFEGRELFVRGSNLYGWIDGVIFTPYRILIIDDKPASFAYFANKLQVWGYCLAFKEMHQPGLPLFGLLEQEETGEIVWIEEFSKKAENLVAESANRIPAILSGEAKAKPTENFGKCRSCRLKTFCKEW